MKMKPIVVLSGGVGSRMEEVGRLIPKFLLPVNSEILLLRTLRQAHDAGYDRVIICTKEEYSEKMTNLIDHFENNDKKIDIVISQPTLIDSLREIEKLLPDQKEFILVLGDIFYIDNPFLGLEKKEDNGDLLVGKKILDETELTKGGVIEREYEDKIKRVVKKPTVEIKQGVRWSGMALCGENFFSDLNELAINILPSQFYLEDAFEYRNIKYHKSRIKDNTDFVNINSPYHHIYANLMALAYNNPIDEKVKNVVSLCAAEIRDLILRSGQQL